MSTSVPGFNPFVMLPPDQAPAIMRGMADGTLYQDGGVIRRVGTQRMFALLKSATSSPDPSKLGPLSTLLNLGSAASLLNLGVSVVGFALLYRKLGQVQEGIRLLDAAVRNGFASVSNRLDDVEARLIGLQLMGLRAQHDLGRVEEKIDRVAVQIDIAQFVPLAMALEQLAELPAGAARDGQWFRAHAERAQSVRLYCLAMIERTNPRELPVSDARFVALRAYIAMAAVAAVTEARCLRAAGDTKTAIKRLETTSEKLLRPSQDVILQLLDGVPALLGARQVESSLGKANAAAIARLLEPEASADDALNTLREYWTERVSEGDAAAIAKLRSLRSEVDVWITRARAARESAEVIELLATVREEYDVCELLNLSAEQWDRALESAPSGEVVLLMAHNQ